MTEVEEIIEISSPIQPETKCIVLEIKPSRKDEQKSRARKEHCVQYARMNRVRHKRQEEQLRNQLCELYIENQKLKNIFQEKFAFTLPSFQLPAIVADDIWPDLLEHKFMLRRSVAHQFFQQQSYIVLEYLNGVFLVRFASSMFSDLMGYRIEELKGCECTIFHGRETDQKLISVFKAEILALQESACSVKYYKKDGTSFDAFIQASPLYGAVVNKRFVIISVTEIKPVPF